jgi:hypothetical protein
MSKKRNIKMMQKALVTVGAGIEMMNSWYNPLKLRLDGFSKSLLLSIREYDEIFEELHWKYCDSVSMPPEMKLVMTLGSSLWFFHMSNHSPSTTPAQNGAEPPMQQAPPPPRNERHERPERFERTERFERSEPPVQTTNDTSAPVPPPQQRRMNGPRSQQPMGPDLSVFPMAGMAGMMGGGNMGGMGGPSPNAMDVTSLLSGLGMVQTLMNTSNKF